MKRFAAILLTFAMFAAGCDEEPIRSYQAPKSRVIDPTGGRVMFDPQPQPNPGTGQTSIRFAAAEHWRTVEDPTGMRQISLAAGEGDATVTITGMALPIRGFDLVANIQRWAGSGQAEMVNPTVEQLADAVQPFGPVDGGQSLIVLEGPKVGVTTVTMPRGPVVWVFKMIGPKQRVAAERQAFEAFVKSVEFDVSDEPSPGTDG
jgi:hypothetical protein